MNRVWLWTRSSSPERTRMYSARRGAWTSMSFSKAWTAAHSWKSELTYSSGSTWSMTWW